ncbi:enoyl-CoA hydratase/carnithine racemase [Frankia sp. EI5c]|uniref:enoyl-CoA hydratase/isomerase family protein n=1 Tax=Frankia sp. EI5c TaxID=683316 RepID=UPI0007C26901|nr:enoyl-CoA hydratase/isomerase family protein [Frankia sp. EI5c]OAA29641.1 enoyl-CoA hydratase/carnithine racemase [Frankia sp. EI5c]
MIDLELDAGLAVITIDRPEARNAISLSTMGELEKAIDAAEGAGALVIRGAGDRAFVSGGDLKELAALRTEDEATAMALRMRTICDRLADFPAPVIAAMNGHALGGGAEVAVSADIRVAADDIRMGFNQSTLAIMPAWGGAERLAALVGPGRALMLAGTGRILGAAEAERLGLIDQVLPRESFDEGWRALARSLTAAPARAIKHVIRAAALARPAEEQAEDAARTFARLWVSDEHWAAAERLTAKRAR